MAILCPGHSPEEEGRASSWGDTINSPSNYLVTALINTMQEEDQSEHLRAPDLTYEVREGFVDVGVLELGWEG